MILYRPVGTKELELIQKSNYLSFPPRLPEQPVFYPVLNEQYAVEIASGWNVKYNEDHKGYVTRFEIDDEYAKQFEVHQAGGGYHKELWIPAESLEEFNEHIIGKICIIAEYPENVYKMSIQKNDKKPEGENVMGAETKTEKKLGTQTICADIRWLVQYGVDTGLVPEEDVIFTTNRLLELFGLEEPEEAADTREPEGAGAENAGEAAGTVSAEAAGEVPGVDGLEAVLRRMCDYACEKGLIEEDGIVYRDLFDTKIMGLLMPRPSEVIRRFRELYEESPEAATDYYYKLSQDSDYIRRYRVCKDMKWIAPTKYGDLDITINLSKPEKDPKAIAAAKNARQSGYPKCLLCRENEGYAGRVNHPARQNHRIIPVTINNSQWGFQYSPYVYYNEHCIVFNSRHVPMKIDHAAFCKLFDFVKQFPHYFVGSNADLPIVGGSILSHDHFQGGHYEFAMAKAPVERSFTVKGFEDVAAGVVNWPMSVIRLSGKDTDRIIALADMILSKWREYTDEAAFIYAYTDGEPHNTITPIARKRGENYELDLVLRNNITTQEHPLGVYHPHAKLHHIKKENIGLIEVMGLAVLPARLKTEMARLKEAILEGADLRADEATAKHADWVEEFKPKYQKIDASNIDSIIESEIGLVFMEVLEDAGVYKRTEEGQKAFDRFILSL